MNEEDRKACESRARVFKALAHPSRIFIVSRLNERPMNVGSLAAAVGADISTVSKHLSILKSEGIVRDVVRGRHVYYELHCSCVNDFLRCVDEVILHSQCPSSGKAVKEP